MTTLPTELWLHKYRILGREQTQNNQSGLKFTISYNTNFADSKLKFKRNMIYILKQIYLHLKISKEQENFSLQENELR